MSDAQFNDKAEQFDRLWDGITPKGVNRTKALKFRQYILRARTSNSQSPKS
ncbi:MAG: hypothetical protein CM15mP3_04220 [Candidatus Poseidoniales archaeon]|nr:MAG: hypothetical protein CM15mP3_04220 [Candidatus Poseidoniales archaeon]